MNEPHRETQRLDLASLNMEDTEEPPPRRLVPSLRIRGIHAGDESVLKLKSPNVVGRAGERASERLRDGGSLEAASDKGSS